MIRINLLPVHEIKQLLKARQEAVALAGLVGVVLFLVACVAFWQLSSINGLKDTLADLNRQKDSYKSVLAEIEKLKEDKAVLERKLSIIKILKKGSQLTVRVLDELINLHPDNRLWLKSLQQSPGTLQLAGTALDNAVIADYMESIERSKYFANAELGQSSEAREGGRKLKSFTLTCGVINPLQSIESTDGAEK